MWVKQPEDRPAFAEITTWVRVWVWIRVRVRG